MNYIKNSILNNAIEGVNSVIQYYLAINTSKWYLGGIWFWQINASLGTKAIHNYKKKLYIIIFMFLWLKNAKT